MLTHKRLILSLSICIVITGLCVIASLMVGPASIGFESIVWDIRLKRILIGLIVGGGLATSGTAFQVILKNPLADPYILGTSSAAAFGAVLGMLSGWPMASVIFLSLLFSFFSIVILMWLLKQYQGSASHFLLLSGVLLSFLFSGLVTIILSVARPFEGARLLFWLMGTLSQPLSWPIIITAGIVALVCWGLLVQRSYELNLLNLGADQALSAGVEPHHLQMVVFIFSAVLTTIAVTLAGTIGFVGLIVPHLIRFLCGHDLRLIMLLSFFGGGLFLVLADTGIRLCSTHELPIGAITACVGAPFFLWLLWQAKGSL